MSLAFVFPGQGSQRVGMLDAVLDAPSAPALLDFAEELSGVALRELAASGTPEDLASTTVAQPLLFCADLLWARKALVDGLAPAAVAGHSLGEFVALVVAGVLEDEGAVRLIVERSRLMAREAERAPGAMSAVLGLDAHTVARLVAGVSGAWVANDNAPGQIIVSGTVEGVAQASSRLSNGGARRIVPLAVSGAFHSPLMEAAAREFAALLEDAPFHSASVPVYQNTDPSPTRDGDLIRSRLTGQMTSPVRWTETMLSLHTDGIDRMLECGPGAVLAGLAKRIEGLVAFSCESDGIAALLSEEVG